MPAPTISTMPMRTTQRRSRQLRAALSLAAKPSIVVRRISPKLRCAEQRSATVHRSLPRDKVRSARQISTPAQRRLPPCRTARSWLARLRPVRHRILRFAPLARMDCPRLVPAAISRIERPRQRLARIRYRRVGRPRPIPAPRRIAPSTAGAAGLRRATPLITAPRRKDSATPVGRRATLARRSPRASPTRIVRHGRAPAPMAARRIRSLRAANVLTSRPLAPIPRQAAATRRLGLATHRLALIPRRHVPLPPPPPRIVPAAAVALTGVVGVPTAADTTKRNRNSDSAARTQRVGGPSVDERVAAGAKPHNCFLSGGLIRAMQYGRSSCFDMGNS